MRGGAGALRRYVTIEKRTLTKQPGGQQVESFSTYEADVPCAIEPLTGRERFLSQTTVGETRARIRMRYRDDLDPTMRIVDGDDVWQIEPPVNLDTRDRELELMATKAKGAGHG